VIDAQQLFIDTINDMRAQIVELRIDIKNLHEKLNNNIQDLQRCVNAKNEKYDIEIRDLMIKIATISGAVSAGVAFFTIWVSGALG